MHGTAASSAPFPIPTQSLTKIHLKQRALFLFQQLPASSLTQLSISNCKASSCLSLEIATASRLLGEGY